MAHIAKLNELSEALVGNITGRAKGDIEFKRLFDHTTKTLKATNHARTNQFDVKSRLDGLVEKFAVLNREDLADGLYTRLQELPDDARWTPETLALLLLLSDRPAEKTRLEDLDEFARQSEASLSLTWDDIIANDPHDESEIWESIAHGYHSSGDEAAADEDDLTSSTDATSVAEDDVVLLARQYVVRTDESAFENAKAAYQSSKEVKSMQDVAELFMIRETLSMLHGLPTTIFKVDNTSGRLSPYERLSIATATNPAIGQALATFADIGTSLNRLRRWVVEKHSVAFLQSCQSTIQDLFANFASRLATLEGKYTSPKTDVAVSILDIRSEVESLAHPLLRLSSLLANSQVRNKATPFAYLDALCDEACIAHMSGDHELFDKLVPVLLASLKTYLRPWYVWIRTGPLHDLDDQTLLAVESDGYCELSNMWQERFSLRTLPNGQPSTLGFLQPMAHRVFALGKSRAFLTALGYDHMQHEAHRNSLPDFTPLLSRSRMNDLLPFSDMLTSTIESWISAVASDCTPILCHALLHDHGAMKIFRHLTSVFCSGDGRAFQAFADTLFWRIENNLRWRDEFLLTELAQSALGNAAGIDAGCLAVTFEDSNTSQPPLSSIAQIASLQLNLLFSPAVQNITRRKSSPVHSKAFVSLLQTYRAKSLLRDQGLDLRTLDTRTSGLPNSMRAALKLRHSLIVLVDILHDHITTTAATLSAKLCRALEAADGIDAMVLVWTEHEELMNSSLLLASNLKPIKTVVRELLELCETFCEIWTLLVNRINARDLDEMSDSAAQSRVSALQTQFDQSLSFVAAGIRSLSRAGGNTALEALADRLQWNVD